MSDFRIEFDKVDDMRQSFANTALVMDDFATELSRIILELSDADQGVLLGRGGNLIAEALGTRLLPKSKLIQEKFEELDADLQAVIDLHTAGEQDNSVRFGGK
jgi:hypothetical protein